MLVVWNQDARNRPELEVEIEIISTALEIPGFYLARHEPELEVEILVVEDLEDLEDPWFLSDDELVALDDYTIYDAPPRDYSRAVRLAI